MRFASNQAAKDFLAKYNETKFPNYAWPGGYPILYIWQSGGLHHMTCGDCATKMMNEPDLDWTLVAMEALEGTSEDHGFVQCDECNHILIDDEEDK